MSFSLSDLSEGDPSQRNLILYLLIGVIRPQWWKILSQLNRLECLNEPDPSGPGWLEMAVATTGGVLWGASPSPTWTLARSSARRT